MGKGLSDYLKTIGQEVHETSYVDATGTLRPITKDEALAREVWKRALGCEEEIKNEDGTATHRVFAPDPKAQQFIFERREGKIVILPDEGSITLLEKISELTKTRLNKIAEDIAENDGNHT